MGPFALLALGGIVLSVWGRLHYPSTEALQFSLSPMIALARLLEYPSAAGCIGALVGMNRPKPPGPTRRLMRNLWRNPHIGEPSGVVPRASLSWICSRPVRISCVAAAFGTSCQAAIAICSAASA